MCGVIGIYSHENIDQKIIKTLLNQSMIRGKHATGISWIEEHNDKKSKIKHKIVKYSADKFDLPQIKTKCLIAHCRYSTSDLKYNQPIISNNIAIAHNGVVTQADPSRWEEMYQMSFDTKCDSEILLKHYAKDIHPLHVEGSMACVILDAKNSPTINFFRNEQRPLYFAKADDIYYIASTKDILTRSNIKNITKTDCCINYSLSSSGLKKDLIRKPYEDLQ